MSEIRTPRGLGAHPSSETSEVFVLSKILSKFSNSTTYNALTVVLIKYLK